MSDTWAVVVPSVRRNSLERFVDAWAPQLEDKHLIVVHDHHTVPGWAVNIDAEHHAWDTIGLEHAARRSDMIRSWGIYRAWEMGAAYTLTLDDDVRPCGDLFSHYETVFHHGAPLSPYLNVGALTTYGKPLRGFPYQERLSATVGVQYGGWHGVLDYDASTQLSGVRDYETFAPVVLPVPHHAPVTGCIMNCAWQTGFAPIMWQLPLIDGKYNRFGDIWSGLFQKKVLDYLGHVMVVNGKASVRHQRASDPVKNAFREAPGIPLNENLWYGLEVGGSSMIDAYREVTDSAAGLFEDWYSIPFLEARDEWLALF